MRKRLSISLTCLGVLVGGSACFDRITREEQACNEARSEEVGRELGTGLKLGADRARVLKFASARGWQVLDDSARDFLVVGDLTYCGLGSSDTFEVRFSFDDRARLRAYEIATRFGTHSKVD